MKVADNDAVAYLGSFQRPFGCACRAPSCHSTATGACVVLRRARVHVLILCDVHRHEAHAQLDGKVRAKWRLSNKVVEVENEDLQHCTRGRAVPLLEKLAKDTIHPEGFIGTQYQFRRRADGRSGDVMPKYARRRGPRPR